MRAILLCSDSMSSRLVAQLVNSNADLLLVLIAKRRSLIRRIAWRVRRLGFLQTLSQVCCGISAKLLFLLRGGAERQREILGAIGLRGEWPVGVTRQVVPGVNHESVATLLNGLMPDIVVVNGTDIIKEHILKVVPGRFVNIHCGLTPEYRGVHGAFWAIWEGRPERVGVTLHEVDGGVDTGRVLAQSIVRWIPERDGLLTLPLLQYEAALPMLRDHLKGKPLPEPVTREGKSKQWYYPGIGPYLKTLTTGRLAH